LFHTICASGAVGCIEVSLFGETRCKYVSTRQMPETLKSVMFSYY
jgi:hypothetical protein